VPIVARFERLQIRITNYRFSAYNAQLLNPLSSFASAA
jgi:hypothetical protein